MYPTPYCNNNPMSYSQTECLCMPKLAQAYVPFQHLTCIYTPVEGLDKGTIFPELYSPYDQCMKPCEQK